MPAPLFTTVSLNIISFFRIQNYIADFSSYNTSKQSSNCILTVYFNIFNGICISIINTIKIRNTCICVYYIRRAFRIIHRTNLCKENVSAIWCRCHIRVYIMTLNPVVICTYRSIISRHISQIRIFINKLHIICRIQYLRRSPSFIIPVQILQLLRRTNFVFFAVFSGHCFLGIYLDFEAVFQNGYSSGLNSIIIWRIAAILHCICKKRVDSKGIQLAVIIKLPDTVRSSVVSCHFHITTRI